MDERRKDGLAGGTVSARMQLGPAVIDRDTGRVETPSGARRLRAKELELMALLFQHPATTFTRGELLEKVWQCRPGLLTRTVDQTMATLRRKLGDTARSPQFLKTVHGVGYRLQV